MRNASFTIVIRQKQEEYDKIGLNTGRVVRTAKLKPPLIFNAMVDMDKADGY